MNTKSRLSIWPCLAVVMFGVVHRPVLAQEAGQVRRDSAETRADSVAAKEAAKWRFIHRNEFETPFFTFRLGAAIIIEQDWYAQDDASKEQLNTDPDAPKVPGEPVESVVPS